MRDRNTLGIDLIPFKFVLLQKIYPFQRQFSSRVVSPIEYPHQYFHPLLTVSAFLSIFLIEVFPLQDFFQKRFHLKFIFLRGFLQ